MKPWIHPATLAIPELLAQCELRRQRRSGPGGQHRNKVETAVVIVHRESGVRGEASEFRSQADNQANAVQRLRIKLAIALRTPEFVLASAPSLLWRSRLQGAAVVVSPKHADFPILLAEALDCLQAHGFEMTPTATQLHCTNSQLLKLLKLEFEALDYVNAERIARELRPLR
jgi:hypothetical protein